MIVSLTGFIADEILCTTLFRSFLLGVLLVQDAVSQLIRKGNRASDANSRMQIARESVKVSPKV